MSECIYKIRESCVKTTLNFNICNSCLHLYINQIIEAMIKVNIDKYQEKQ
jgi:hypothetical protein